MTGERMSTSPFCSVPLTHKAANRLTLASGYDRTKKKFTAMYREMTLDEMKALEYGRHVSFIDKNNEQRTAKVNGKPKTWKRHPYRCEVPLKYGMYEYFTVSSVSGYEPMLIVTVPGSGLCPACGESVKFNGRETTDGRYILSCDDAADPHKWEA